MAEYLFFVESDEKAKMIRSLAGDRIDVVVLIDTPATFVVGGQLAKGGSGFNFKPVSSLWAPVVAKLSGYTEVYYCFDTSLAGEQRSYLAHQLLLLSGLGIQGHRLHVSGFTKELLWECQTLPEPLAEARCIRHFQEDLFLNVFFSHLNRLLGTTLGPRQVGLSITTLTLLALLAEKHQMLTQMVRSPKWEVEVLFQQDGQDVTGRLTEVYGVSSDGLLESGEQAKEMALAVKGQKFSLVDRSDQEVRFPSPELYTLPELVLDAYRFHKLLPGDVLSLLDSLYVGVEMGQGRRGLITSPHGVSVQNMQPVFATLCQYVTTKYGGDAGLAAEYGEGVILPTDPTLLPDELKLSKALQQVYGLIWARSVASQMDDALGRDQKILFERDGKRVQFGALTLASDGFLTVFPLGYEAVFTDSNGGLFEHGDTVLVSKAAPRQSKPQAVSQYQITSLCEDMQEMGFDDEQQIITLLQQLIHGNYVNLGAAEEILCSDVLLKVTRTIDRAFPGMKGLNLSAYYSQTVEEVVSGRKRLDVALKQFDQNLVMQGVPLVKVKIPKAIAKGKRKSKNVIKGGGGTSTVVSVTEGFADFDSATPPSEASLLEPPEEVELPSSPKEDVPDAAVGIDEIPDIVSGDEEVAVVSPEPAELEDEPPPLVEEEPVQVAAESPEDVFAEPPSPEEPELEVVPVLKEDEAPVEAAVVETKTCPECGRDMVVKDDRFGKFWSCTGMPACHHSETYEKKKSVKERLSCPLCKCGTLTVNRTPAGKDMYICDDAACEFMAWAKPHAISCPLCNSPFLVQKKDRQGNISLRCPMAGCSYIHGGTADESVVKPKKKKIRVRRKKGSGGVKKRRVVRRRKK